MTTLSSVSDLEPTDSYKLHIGQILRYPRVTEDPTEYAGDLVNFRWLAKFERPASLKLERGINAEAAVTEPDGVERRTVIIIFSRPHNAEQKVPDSFSLPSEANAY